MDNEYLFNSTNDDRLPKRNKRKKGNTMAHLLVMFCCLIVLVLLTYLAIMVYVWVDGKEQDASSVIANVEDLNVNNVNNEETGAVAAGYTQEELDARVAEALALGKQEGSAEIMESIKTALISDELTIVEMLRPYYKDELVLVSSGNYHFVPIQENLKKNDYVQENLQILENGEYQYVEDGQVTSYKGIDVSKFQEEIDWEAVAADGVQFAFIRVGNRGYGAAGKLLEDDRFEENVEGALKAGIKVGAYFYTQALNEEELREEVNLVLEKIAPYRIECPVVFDIEKVDSAKGRMNALSVEERTYLTGLFCQLIEEAGYKPMIYYNMEMAALMLDLTQLEEYDKWFAYYNPEFYYPYDYKIWQYTHNGRVNGIEGAVDLNISFEPLWE